MFREMRRKKQALSLEECIQVLDRGTLGVLAVSGDDDYPYAVPLSYIYHDDKTFFHCAKAGHKLDTTAKNIKVSFCVIDQDQVILDEYTSYFRSVIVFGKAHILEEETEKRNATDMLTEGYAPSHEESRHLQAIEKELYILRMIGLTIGRTSGKEAIELVKAKRAQDNQNRMISAFPQKNLKSGMMSSLRSSHCIYRSPALS